MLLVYYPGEGSRVPGSDGRNGATWNFFSKMQPLSDYYNPIRLKKFRPLSAKCCHIEK